MDYIYQLTTKTYIQITIPKGDLKLLVLSFLSTEPPNTAKSTGVCIKCVDNKDKLFAEYANSVSVNNNSLIVLPLF